MRSYRLLHSLLLVPAIAACGDDGGSGKPDAFVIVGDATPDTPPPPPGCEYGELYDATNDDDGNGGGQPEQSGVTFGGSAVFCGKLNTARYDATSDKLDADAYTFTLTGDTELYISMYGAGLEGLDEVSVQIYGGQSFGSFVTGGTFAGNHAAAITALPAGTYEIYVGAYNSGAPASDVGYKVKLTADDLAARCAAVTTGGFAEANDGANNTSNDMIGVDWDFVAPDTFQSFTTATDAPENTALTIVEAMNYRFSGTAQSANPIVGSYRDRDTFEITTGTMMNQITIRSAWASTMADLDMFVFEMPLPAAPRPFDLSQSTTIADGPTEEVVTLAVKPNTKYWIWVGTDSMSTEAAAYSTTICGATYTPPAN